MRLRRVLAPDEGYYHVISRIAGQQFLLNAKEKDVLTDLLFRTAEFSGVEVFTHVFMDNHFHLLLKVPRVQEVDDEELVRRMTVLYGNTKTERILNSWETWEKKGLNFKVLDAKAALRRRMYDLSQFCKTLKETYSMSYNRRNGHSGTIWGSRFKSQLLAPDYKTLMTVGAYIDLNPVRADIGDAPGAYRWSGAGMAKRGHTISRNGIRSLVAMAYKNESVDYEMAMKLYASAMDGFIEHPVADKSEEQEEVQSETVPRQQTFEVDDVEDRIEKGGKLSLYEMLRCKVRHFSHGLAIGPASFVYDVVSTLTSRKNTVRRCDCCDDIQLYTARWLRGDDKVSVPKQRAG